MTMGDAVTTTTGVVVDRLTECPLCKGLGCVVCNETGMVKQVILDRAREPMEVGRWTPDMLERLARMLWGPIKGRRERTREQRAYLEANEAESRLDRLDREPKHRRTDG